MNKGIIIGIIAIIIGVSAIAVSSNNSEVINEIPVSEEISEIPVSEEISEIPVSEEIESEPNQFTVGLSESIGFTEG